MLAIFLSLKDNTEYIYIYIYIYVYILYIYILNIETNVE